MRHEIVFGVAVRELESQVPTVLLNASKRDQPKPVEATLYNQTRATKFPPFTDTLYNCTIVAITWYYYVTLGLCRMLPG